MTIAAKPFLAGIKKCWISIFCGSDEKMLHLQNWIIVLYGRKKKQMEKKTPPKRIIYEHQQRCLA